MFLDYLIWGPWGLLIILPGIILGIYAQSKVSSTFGKYSRVNSASGISGRMVAKELLAKNEIYDVEITKTSGNLTDHYNPKTSVVALSDGVYGSTSVAAIGVAAHEIGHVIQHKKGYFPMKVRSAIIPVVRVANMAFIPLFLVGFLIDMFVQTGSAWSSFLINFAIILYGGSTLLALCTLPVEFNASKRAYQSLAGGVLTSGEAAQAKKVLDAAALTYVASFVTSLLYFLRFLMLFARRD